MTTTSNRPLDEPHAKTADSRWKWLYRAGGVIALTLFTLFLIGIIGIVREASQPTAIGDWLTPLQDNWLVILFKLNAGFSGVQSDSLGVLNLLDIVIMALFGVLFLALYATLRHTHKIPALIAASLPILGIVVFLITSTAGRSGNLVGGLIISAIMLRSAHFGKVSAATGIVASALLFIVGDIGTAIFPASMVIAIFIGIGYMLWMIWFFLIARRLFQLERGENK